MDYLTCMETATNRQEIESCDALLGQEDELDELEYDDYEDDWGDDFEDEDDYEDPPEFDRWEDDF